MKPMDDEKTTGKNPKPEHMTSLSLDCLVSKTHGRIAFRGCIDTFQAEVIEAQVLAAHLGQDAVCGNLGEILEFLRSLMAAEVRETPLPPLKLFGMGEAEIHRQSRGVFVLPCYTQGPLAARLNTLRAKAREAELLAVKVFGPEEAAPRQDIVRALNRLSSALWWLFCTCAADGEK